LRRGCISKPTPGGEGRTPGFRSPRRVSRDRGILRQIRCRDFCARLSCPQAGCVDTPLPAHEARQDCRE